MNVSFIGTGIMGSRMAANLLGAGQPLTVYNRTAAKADELVAKGATRADSIAAAARGADVVVTMLSEPRAVKTVAEILWTNLADNALWMNCSTVNPSFAAEMSAETKRRGFRYLDAPVAGSKAAAGGAQLVFFLGGDAADVAEVKPLTDAMGQKVVHLGAAGQGSALKVVVNQQLAVAMASFAEGVALGESLGLPRELVVNVLLNGPLVPAFMGAKREAIMSDDYTSDVHFPLQWMQKDLEMATHSAYESGATMPVSSAAKESYRAAMRRGLAEADFAAIFDYYTRTLN